MANQRQLQESLPLDDPSKIYAVIRPLVEVHPETADSELPPENPLWTLQDLAYEKFDRGGFPPHVPIIGAKLGRSLRKRNYSAADMLERIATYEGQERMAGKLVMAQLGGVADNPQALKIVRLQLADGLTTRLHHETRELCEPTMTGAYFLQHHALHINQGRDRFFAERMLHRYNRQPIKGSRVVLGKLLVVGAELRPIAHSQQMPSVAV